MTEAEWFASTDPRLMLQVAPGGLSERRLRLFILACCHRIWGHEQALPTRALLEAAERFTNGGLAKPWREVVRVPQGHVKLDCSASEWYEMADVEAPSLQGIASMELRESVAVLGCTDQIPSAIPWLTERWVRAGLALDEQAVIFRDVARGPFRPLTFRAAWRLCHDSAVLHVAEEIDRNEAFCELPILADALMDAGCDCDELIRHLQEPSGHIRGCWGLDLVLGRF